MPGGLCRICSLIIHTMSRLLSPQANMLLLYGHNNAAYREYTIAGLGRWTGLVDWTGGLEICGKYILQWALKSYKLPSGWHMHAGIAVRCIVACLAYLAYLHVRIRVKKQKKNRFAISIYSTHWYSFVAVLLEIQEKAIINCNLLLYIVWIILSAIIISQYNLLHWISWLSTSSCMHALAKS